MQRFNESWWSQQSIIFLLIVSLHIRRDQQIDLLRFEIIKLKSSWKQGKMQCCQITKNSERLVEHFKHWEDNITSSNMALVGFKQSARVNLLASDNCSIPTEILGKHLGQLHHIQHETGQLHYALKAALTSRVRALHSPNSETQKGRMKMNKQQHGIVQRWKHNMLCISQRTARKTSAQWEEKLWHLQ